MSKRRIVPAYPAKPHRTGQARIRLGGREIYLGTWGSPKSRAEYARRIAEFEAADLAAAVNATPAAKPTVAELVDQFRQWAQVRYVKNGRQTTEVGMYRIALGPVLELYGDSFASEFGPLAMLACREKLKSRGYCRTKINSYLGRIRRVWKFGVSRQLVHESVWRALTSVEGLRVGEAADRPKITCVPEAQIEAIKTHCPPTVWAMIQLQLFTGMRPGEVCQMRTCDIVSEDSLIPAEVRALCWTFRPQSHKTEHHERGRLILIGPHAQQLLNGWLRPDAPDEFLFSPREAVAYFRRLQATNRKSKRYGNRKLKRNPKRSPREYYTPDSYNHVVSKACKRAKVPHWHPNQLRHNAATIIRKLYGTEAARVILGHASLNTTEIYAERDIVVAAKAISRIG